MHRTTIILTIHCNVWWNKSSIIFKANNWSCKGIFDSDWKLTLIWKIGLEVDFSIQKNSDWSLPDVNRFCGSALQAGTGAWGSKSYVFSFLSGSHLQMVPPGNNRWERKCGSWLFHWERKISWEQDIAILVRIFFFHFLKLRSWQLFFWWETVGCWHLFKTCKEPYHALLSEPHAVMLTKTFKNYFSLLQRCLFSSSKVEILKTLTGQIYESLVNWPSTFYNDWFGHLLAAKSGTGKNS